MNDIELHEKIQSKALKQVDIQTQDQQGDSEEEVENPESIRNKLRNLIRSDHIDMCLKVRSISFSLGKFTAYPSSR